MLPASSPSPLTIVILLILQTQPLGAWRLKEVPPATEVPLIYDSCGQDYFYNVTQDDIYHVMIRPGSQMSCSEPYVLKFHSPNPEGKLCLAQDEQINHIYDRGAKLTVFDGDEYGEKIFDLEYYPSEWQSREYCTKTQDITFRLEKLYTSPSINTSKLEISLKVMDIQSVGRQLYMDERYCENTYSLANSQVAIFNRPPENSAFPPHNLMTPCGLYVKKEIQDTRICLAYVPSNHVTCGSSWIFKASTENFKLDQGIVYELHCQDNNATRKHVWCASNDTTGLTLILQREDVSSTVEPSKMFHFLLIDHHGTEQSLLKLLEAEAKKQGEDDDGGLPGAGIAGIVIAVIIVTIILAFVGVKYMRYRREHMKVPTFDS